MYRVISIHKQIMKTNLTKSKVFRQGDVLIVPCGSIPTDLKKTNRVTLALGEVTGHHHSIAEGANGYASDVDALCDFVEVTAGTADLTHQEHETIALPAGTYRIVRQVEYSPAELRNVRD